MLMLSFLIPQTTNGTTTYVISSILTPEGIIDITTTGKGTGNNQAGGDAIQYLLNAQNAGYKIICSFGGATADQAIINLFSDSNASINLADSMAYGLCRKGGSNPLNWTQLTTLNGSNTFAFDGIDLDFELSGAEGSYQTECQNMLNFVKRLRNNLNQGGSNGILTMSFQSPNIYGSGGGNIANGFGNCYLYQAPYGSGAQVSSYNPYSAPSAPSPPTGFFALTANMNLFDYINIQTYNQGGPSTNQPGGGWGPTDMGGVFPQSIGAYGYAAFIQSQGKTKIYPGFLSDDIDQSGWPLISAQSILTNGGSTGPNLVTAITTAVQLVQATPNASATTASSWLAGFMSWQSPYGGEFVRGLIDGIPNTITNGATLGWQVYGGQTYSSNGYPSYGPGNPGWDQNPPK
jgi:hypothetical protein